MTTYDSHSNAVKSLFLWSGALSKHTDFDFELPFGGRLLTLEIGR